jgi:hypothetical protein
MVKFIMDFKIQLISYKLKHTGINIYENKDKVVSVLN